MADCINWRIIDALKTLLSSITTANHYEINVASVFIPKKTLSITSYPAILLYYNTADAVEEGFFHESADLDVILVYTDGKDDSNESESYIERYKNVGADIRKCIQTNPSLGALCEYVQVVSEQPGLFQDGDLILEAHVTYLKISRTANQTNPYL